TPDRGVLLVNHNLEIVAANDNVIGWLGYRWHELFKMNITAVFPKLVGRTTRLQQLMNAPDTKLAIERVRQIGHDGRPMPTFNMQVEMEMGYMRIVLERVYIEESAVEQRPLSHARLGFSRMNTLFHSTVNAFALRIEQERLAEESYRFETASEWGETSLGVPALA
ncbi:MAG: hypothetical protein KDD89_15950, partial [Anaerolineales bacterium]|nr:hypothetical protein [Anaerolineales bacterium]